jgi:thiamine-monophosphate kinase
MAMNESEIIARFFLRLGTQRTDVVLGIGDDAAVLAVPPGMELIATTDTLVAGTHFLPGSSPRSLGHRALAVNLSDCAAMAATPSWALLSLVLPAAEESWLEEFSAGFGALAQAHNVALVGGNLTRGPLNITVQLMGLVASGQALRRSGGRAGDCLCLTGSVGDAAAGLAVQQGKLVAADGVAGAALCRRFEFPEPRVQLGCALGAIASACIDISDGVQADISRLAASSNCGAELNVDQLPVSEALRQAAGAEAWRYALQGGEDYELAITVPPTRLRALQEMARNCHTPLAVVGQLRAAAGLACLHQGREIAEIAAGFDHFGG